MAGSLPGGALNALGTALIPETMARLQMPALIDQAKREQQVGNIQAGRLLGGADAEIGTPQTKSYQVNGRTIGQDNPSTIQPLFSPAKKMALFSQAMPEQARAFQAQQIQNSIAPRPLSKDDFIGEPGKGGVFNIRKGAIEPGTQITEEQAPYSDVGKLFTDFRAGRLPADAFQKELNRLTTGTQQETWANPVSEVGPDGKPIQVRYSNLGGRRVVDGATPARQGNSFDRQDYWRGYFKPLLDAATDVGIQSSKVGNSLDLDSGTGHIAAVNALQKMIDQGAVVREQDVALIQSAQSFLQQHAAEIEKLKTGKLLSPALQKEMRDLARSLERAIYDGTLDRINANGDTMKSEGVDMKQVLPDALYRRMAPQTSGEYVMGAAPGLPNTMQSGQRLAPIGESFQIAGGTATRIK